jgi:hypothetical protein
LRATLVNGGVMKKGDTLRKCKEFKVAQVKELVNQCTYEQREKFVRIFGNKIHALDDQELNNAIRICEATIIKNESS